MGKVETVAEFLARGGRIEKVHAGGQESVSYANRTLKNTKKSEWNQLKQWRTKAIAKTKGEVV